MKLKMAIALLALGAFLTPAHGEVDIWACYGSARYQAQSSAWTPCTEMSKICIKVREYIDQGHTPDEGRAWAAKQHVPAWIIRKAERCLP